MSAWQHGASGSGAPHLSRRVSLHALMLTAQLHQPGGLLHRAHESGIQSQEHERQAALRAFEQERGRQQQVLQAEHQAALQVMQTERYCSPCQPCSFITSNTASYADGTLLASTSPVHHSLPPEVLPSLWSKLLRCQAVTRQTQVQVPVVTC